MAERQIRYPQISRQIIAIVGGFGSGKTEVAVNLTKYLMVTQRVRSTIVDLDLVNPYFRSREAIGEMEAMGIRVIAPRGGQYYADLPILLPEVRGAVEKGDGVVILDVGGDAQGARALGSISTAFSNSEYDMWMVLNSRRPQTADAKTAMTTMARIETVAKLEFTGLIANSHLIDESDSEVLHEGYLLAQAVGKARKLPLVFLSAKRNVLELVDLDAFDCPILPLTRSMLKPWEREEINPEDTQSRK